MWGKGYLLFILNNVFLRLVFDGMGSMMILLAGRVFYRFGDLDTLMTVFVVIVTLIAQVNSLLCSIC